MEKEQFGRFKKGRGNALESKGLSLKNFQSKRFADTREKKGEASKLTKDVYVDRTYRKEKEFVFGEKPGGLYRVKKDFAFENKKFNGFERTGKVQKKIERVKRIQPNYDNTPFIDYSKPMRLNRYLANAGICSRREADNYIEAGVVTVNGKVVSTLGSRVVPSIDKVMFHDEPIKIERRVYILLNKPKDYVTTAEDPHASKKVLDLVRGACRERIYPVGRLDRNTTGVLLLTNDGELTSKLTHPSSNKKKIYQVTLDKDVIDEDVEKITKGVTLEDGEIAVDEFSFVKDSDRRTVGVEIHSGKNRIVRRIFESLGYKVVKLDRVYFAGLTKKNLPRGKWRFLSEQEVNFLKMM